MEVSSMAGTTEGGKAAALKNKQVHGEDFYARIGAMGGKKGRTGGFFANRELAREAGRKGGRISRRTKKATAEAEAREAEVSKKDFDLAA